MNPTIKINLDNLKKIIWPIIALGIAKYYEWFNSRVIVLVYIASLLVIIGFMGKLVIPRVRGLNFYLIFIVYSTSVGILLYDARDVLRDLYYVLPTVILVIMGYYLYYIYGDKLSIIRTLVFLGTIISTLNFIEMIRNPQRMNEFTGIRGIFSSGSQEVLIGFIALFSVVFVSKQKIFSKWPQRYCMTVMLVNLILTLARSTWMEVGIGCALILIVNAFFNNQLKKSLLTLLKLTIVTVLLLTIFFCSAPDRVVDEFTEKFAKSAEELNSEQEFNSVDSAMENWRAYEIQSAQEQWKDSNALMETFGAGMGKGVELDYVPYTWSDMVENNEIPLLHNAYYTILAKGGVVGVLALIWFMLAGVVYALKYLRKGTNIQRSLILLTSISVVFLVDSYTIRGPVSQNANISWCLLIGWINAEMNQINVEND